MIIRNRQTIVEVFSTFLKLEYKGSNLLTDWLADSKLARNVRQILQVHRDATQRILAESWLSEYLQNPQNPQNKLARLHLAAYLDEPCAWIAYNLAKQRSTNSFNFDLFQEYLQIGRVKIADDLKVLKGYDSSVSDKANSIINYFNLKVTSAILETTGEKKKSDAALLRRQTPTSLKRALQAQGITETGAILSRCLLAWHCFNATYTPTEPTVKRLPWPKEQGMQAIANCYNEWRSSYEISQSVTSPEVETLLKTCVDALRNKLQVRNYGQEEELDFLADQENSNTLDRLAIVQEWDRIKECLANAFAALPRDAQTMLLLWEGLEFRQGDVGELFDIKRDQIGNKFKSWRKALLKELLKWGTENLGITLSSKEINEKAKLMDEWLMSFCQETFYNFLQDEYNQLKQARVADDQIKQQLQSRLQDYVQQNLGISLSRISEADLVLAEFVDGWLSN